jgi:hypothetical protein
MAFYATKPSLIDPSITVYYAGGNRWSDQSSEKVTFATREGLDAKVVNLDGKTGGFKNATVVEE